MAEVDDDRFRSRQGAHRNRYRQQPDHSLDNLHTERNTQPLQEARLSGAIGPLSLIGGLQYICEIAYRADYSIGTFVVLPPPTVNARVELA